ncbi:MAG: XRE family transcriptional regulator [Leucobacter sp.]
MDDEGFLTADLARAARAFTKVSTRTIAESAGLSKEQVRSFEQGTIDLPAEDKVRLKQSLEKYGALFIPEDEHGGYGVRRKYPREKLLKLNTWEGEGGHPA